MKDTVPKYVIFSPLWLGNQVEFLILPFSLIVQIL